MNKYYFLETVSIKGTFKVKAIKGQIFSDGKDVDTGLYVQSPKSIRELYPEGTIFYATELNLSNSGRFYTSKGFSRLTYKDDEAKKEYKTLTGIDFVDPLKKDTILETILKDASLISPSSTKDGFYMTPDNWRILVRNIKKHVNTMIIGPTGSGKTSCVKEVCSRMGIPLHVFDMGSMIDPISNLLGVHRLEDGKSIFDYAKFTKVIQEPCVILLDELNRSSLGANNVLFPCLDDRRELNVEIACGKGVRSIKIHPEVTFIATANIGSEYTGTNMIDRALLNRFFPLELNIIPDTEEVNVLVNRTGIDKEVARSIVKIANNIRSLSKKQEISTSISIRETLMISELVSDGWSVKSAMEMVYLPIYEGTNLEGERSTVYKTILSY